MPAGEPDTRVLSAIITQNYVLSATVALVVYEYAITWRQEAQTIWRRKFTVTSSFLVAIRYTMLLAPLAQLISQFSKRFVKIIVGGCSNDLRTAASSCHTYRSVSVATAILISLEISGFSALRAYALSNRNRSLSVLVLILGGLFPCIIIALVAKALVGQRVSGPFDACIVTPNSSSSHASRAMYSVYLYSCCLIAAELLVLAITWSATIQQIRVARNSGIAHYPLATALVRNGVLYFIVILCPSFLGLAAQISGSITLGESTLLAQYLPLLVANRFITNLREIGRVAPVTYASQGAPTIQFQRHVSAADENDGEGPVPAPSHDGENVRNDDAN